MKASNYGDVGAWFLQKRLVAYVEFGSYQGEYIAAFEDGDDVVLYKGYYGSCSGCDWLEDRKDWETGEVSEEDANKFSAREFSHPFATIPKETILRVDTETFESFLPRNVRGEIYEFDAAALHQSLKAGVEAPSV